MKTNQPSYHCITNIGDVNPEEYGGQFVCIDKTGFYDPILLVYDADFDTLYDITLTRCIRVNEESVSDNVYHPSSLPGLEIRNLLKLLPNLLEGL